MYLILCHPLTALPLTVVSASIPLALPRSPQSLCSFKSLPCIYPSAPFLSPFLHRWLFRSVFLLQPNTHTHTHTLTHTQTHIMQLIKKWQCRVHIRTGVNKWGEEGAELLSNHVSRLCCSWTLGQHTPGLALEIKPNASSRQQDKFSSRNISQ